MAGERGAAVSFRGPSPPDPLQGNPAMATDPDFVGFVLDQIEPPGFVTARRMFGEYALYADERVVALACDDRLFVKPTSGGRAFIGDPVEGPPYPGAKPYFLIEERLEDRDWLSELLRITAGEVPLPNPRRKKEG
jgi:TfoX/Sxy family transcriptional regulator of competence genes